MNKPTRTALLLLVGFSAGFLLGKLMSTPGTGEGTELTIVNPGQATLLPPPLSSKENHELNSPDQVEPRFTLDSDEIIVSKQLLEFIEFEPFLRSGKLSAKTKGLLSIDVQEKNAIENSMRKASSEFQQLEIESREILTEDDGSGHIKFVTKPNEAASQRIKSAFDNTIMQILGSKRGRDFNALTRKSLSKQFGGFDQKTVEISPNGQNFDIKITIGNSSGVYRNAKDVPYELRHLVQFLEEQN